MASDSEGEDIEDTIAREMEGLKNLKRGSQERRFQATHTDVKNVVFIQCRDPVDPCQLLHHLFREIVEEGKQKSRSVLHVCVLCCSVCVCVSVLCVCERM